MWASGSGISQSGISSDTPCIPVPQNYSEGAHRIKPRSLYTYGDVIIVHNCAKPGNLDLSEGISYRSGSEKDGGKWDYFRILMAFIVRTGSTGTVAKVLLLNNNVSAKLDVHTRGKIVHRRTGLLSQGCYIYKELLNT